MARDFGAKERPRWRPGDRWASVRFVAARAALIAGFLVFASLPTMFAMSMGSPPDPDEMPKTIVGQPCPTITQAKFYRGYREAPKTFVFLHATFTRRRGHADCRGRSDQLASHYPVCEFNAPVELAVTLDGKHYWYDVGPGYTAIVEARPTGPRCTITGRFNLMLGS